MNGSQFIRLFTRFKEQKEPDVKSKFQLPGEVRLKLFVPVGYELIPLRYDLFYRLGIYDFKTYVFNYLGRRGVDYKLANLIASILVADPVNPTIKDFQWYFSLLHFALIPSSLAVRLGAYFSFALKPDESLLHHGRFIRTKEDAEVYEKYVQEQGIVSKFREVRDKLVQEFDLFRQHVDKVVNGGEIKKSQEPDTSVKEQEKEGEVKSKLGMHGISLVAPAAMNTAIDTGISYAMHLFDSCHFLYKFLLLFQKKVWSAKLGKGVHDIDIRDDEYLTFEYYCYKIPRNIQTSGRLSDIQDVLKFGTFWNNVIINLVRVKVILEAIVLFLKVGQYLKENSTGISIGDFIKKSKAMPISIDNFKTKEGIERLDSILSQVKDVRIPYEIFKELRDITIPMSKVVRQELYQFELKESIGRIIAKYVQIFGKILYSELYEKLMSWEGHLNNRYKSSAYNVIDTEHLYNVTSQYFQGLQRDPDVVKRELFGVEGRDVEQAVNGFLSWDTTFDFNSYVDEYIWGSSGLGKQFLDFVKIFSFMMRTIDDMYKSVSKRQEEGEVYKNLLTLFDKTKQFIDDLDKYDSIQRLIEDRPVSEDIKKAVIQTLYITYFRLSELLKLEDKDIQKVLDKILKKVEGVLYWDSAGASFIKSQQNNVLDMFAKEKLTPEDMAKINAQFIHVVSVTKRYMEKMFQLLPEGGMFSLGDERDFNLEQVLDQDKLKELKSFDIVTSPEIVELKHPERTIELGLYVGFSHQTAELVYDMIKYDSGLSELFYDIISSVIKQKQKDITHAEDILEMYRMVFASVIGDYVPSIRKMVIAGRPTRTPRLMEPEPQIYVLDGTNYFELFTIFITFSYADIFGHYLSAEEYEPDVFKIPYINASRYADEYLNHITSLFKTVKFFKHKVGHDVVIVAGAEDKETIKQLWMASKTDVGRNFIGTLMTEIAANKISPNKVIDSDIVRGIYRDVVYKYEKALKDNLKDVMIGDKEVKEIIQELVQWIQKYINNGINTCVGNFLKLAKHKITFDEIKGCLDGVIEVVKSQEFLNKLKEKFEQYGIKYTPKVGKYFGKREVAELLVPEEQYKEFKNSLTEYLARRILLLLDNQQYKNMFGKYKVDPKVNELRLALNRYSMSKLKWQPKKPKRVTGWVT